MHKRLYLIITVLLLAGLAGMGVACRKSDFSAQGYRYGRYGPTHILGKLWVDSDANLDGALDVANNVAIAAPTAVGTATPAAVVNSLGVSNILEVRDASTPVFTINNGGAVTQVGARTATGGDTVNNWAKVAAPTAVATATPAMVVDSLGVSNLFEVRDAATPVFTIQNGGTVVGTVLQYASSGEKAVAVTQGITTTGAIAHGLTTVTWAVCTLGEDPSASGTETAHITIAISGNTVTAKAWQDDGTTASDEADVTVHCLVIGTP